MAMDGRRWMTEVMNHHYDPASNVLHFWFPKGVELTTEERIDAFSDAGLACAKACTKKPYLLIEYSRIYLVPELAPYYARSILRMKDAVVDAYRYGLPMGDPMRVHISASVRSATAKGFGRSNFYPDEGAARAAIKQAQSKKRT